jgi:hypothetical protein
MKTKTKIKSKKHNKICDGLSFSDCELAILRQAVDKAEEMQGREIINSSQVKKIISIVEAFLRNKALICYGGTAINNILPKQDQFYNKDVSIPDYDFYSPNALKDAKELTDIYFKEGFTEVEAKSGQHHGTYKIYVDFIPVADITQLPKELYQSLKQDSMRVAGIYYASPNFLRMGMYLELSRPAGDVSRWEKVLKRLSLLNKNYPLNAKQCSHINFQRNFKETETESESGTDEIYENVKNTLIDQGTVFFGGYAISMYSQHMPDELRHQLQKIPDFDVLSEEPLLTAQIVKERLEDIGIENVKIVKRPGIGEIISPHYEIKVGSHKDYVKNDTIAFIYEPIACHSYNIVHEGGNEIKVATIDTMLSFYLAFLYADRPYYDKDRLLCMSKYLFDVQEKNRLTQKGVLRRFSLKCIGHQKTLEEMRAEKSEKFNELKSNKNAPEYEEWFLRYRPNDIKEMREKIANTNIKTVAKKSSTKAKTKKNRKKSIMEKLGITRRK